MQKFVLAYLLIIACLSVSCYKSEPESDVFLPDYSHFLPSKDLTRVYRVDSFLFKDGLRGIEIDSISYLMEEFEIQRKAEVNALQVWMASLDSRIDSFAVHNRIWQHQFDRHSFRTFSDNRILVELSFPGQLNRSWDPLAHFDHRNYTEIVRDEPVRPFLHWQRARIISVNDSLAVGDKLYKDLICVLYVDHENALERRYFKSWFASDLGVVGIDAVILDTQRISSDPWEKKAQKGYIFRKRLLGVK